SDRYFGELAARDDIAALAPRLDASVRLQGRDGTWQRVRLIGLDLVQLGAFHPQWFPRLDGTDLGRALREPALLVSDAAWTRLGFDIAASAGPGMGAGASAPRSTTPPAASASGAVARPA